MKKIYLALGILAFATALTFGTTGAFFTDSESTGDNRLTAATLSIDAIRDPQDTLPSTFENLQPGESRTVRLDVKNTGNIPTHIRFSFTGTWNAPSINPAYFVVGAFERFEDSNSTWVKLNSGDRIAAGTFVEYAGSSEQGLIELLPGATAKFRITATLDPRAGNEYQGRTFAATFRIDAKQIAEGAPWPASGDVPAPEPEPEPANPEITAIAPLSIVPGGTVLITGSNFSTTANTITLRGPGSFTLTGAAVNSAISISVPSTAPAGLYTIVVAAAGRSSNTARLTVTEAPTPVVVTSITPASGLPGTAVTIAGSGFSTTASNKIVFKKTGGTDTQSLIGTSANGTSMTVTAPGLPAGMYDVTVINGKNVSSAARSFEITAAPTPTDHVVVGTLSKTSPAVGEEFTVALSVASAENVNSVITDLVFDPALLEYKKTEAGPFLTENGAVFAIVLANQVTPGQVVLSVDRLGAQKGVSGSGTMAVFTFARKAAGVATISFANNALSIKEQGKDSRLMTGNGWQRVEVR